MKHIKLRLISWTLRAIVMVSSVCGCKPDTDIFQQVDYQKLGYILSDNANLSTFNAAVGVTDVKGVLNSTDSTVLFAPNDLYLVSRGVNASTIVEQPSNIINAFVNNHVLDDYIDLASLPYFVKQKLYSRSGHTNYVSRWVKDDLTYYTVNGLRIEEQPIRGANGIIYVLNGMLQQFEYATVFEAIKSDFSMTLFTHVIERAGLASLFNELNNCTVFVPTNQALAAIGLSSLEKVDQADVAVLRKLVLYHVYPDILFVGDLSFTTNFSGSSLFTTTVTLFNGNRTIASVAGKYGLREVKMYDGNNIQLKFYEGYYTGIYTSQLNLIDRQGRQILVDYDRKDIVTKSGAIHQIHSVLNY